MEIKDIDKYLTYLKNNPEEIKRINDEFDDLWDDLKEIEKDSYI